MAIKPNYPRERDDKNCPKTGPIEACERTRHKEEIRNRLKREGQPGKIFGFRVLYFRHARPAVRAPDPGENYGFGLVLELNGRHRSNDVAVGWARFFVPTR